MNSVSRQVSPYIGVACDPASCTRICSSFGTINRQSALASTSPSPSSFQTFQLNSTLSYLTYFHELFPCTTKLIQPSNTALVRADFYRSAASSCDSTLTSCGQREAQSWSAASNAEYLQQYSQNLHHTAPATMASMPSSDQIIYISSASTSPAPEPAIAAAPSEERILSSPDPISLEATTAETTRTDATAPPAKKRKISSDTGLHTPKSVKGGSPPKQTPDSHSGRKLSHVQIPRASLPSTSSSRMWCL
jgi:hypothetical protein